MIWLRFTVLMTAMMLTSQALSYPCLVLGSYYESRGMQAVEGKPEAVPYLEAFYPNATFFFLGEGIKGGSVYRVQLDSQGPPLVVKVYRDPTSLTNDLEVQSIYAAAFQGHNAFEVATFRQVNANILEVQNVEGVTFEKLFKTPGFNTVEKEALLERFIKELKTADTLISEWHKNTGAKEGYILKDNRVELTGWGDWRYLANISKGNTALNVLIKWNNIIVTPDGRLVIIDPY